MTTTAEPRARRKVDSRVAARRVEVTRTAGRRRLRVLLVVLGLGALVGIAYLVTRSPVLDVDTVAVRASSPAGPEADLRTTADEVMTASGIDAGDPMLYLDAGAAASRVEELPWIAEASVDKSYPGDITITVTERVPVGWVRVAEEQVALVDRSGRVLADDEKLALYIPELRGVGALPSPGGTLDGADAARIAAALPEELLGHVVAIALDGPDARLLLREGGEVRLGDPAAVDVDDALAAAEAVRASLGERPVSYIDVRVPGAPVVGP